MADQFFRVGVGIVVTDGGGRVLGFERFPAGSERWQFPQGGLDAEEDAWTAALRELEEETGIGAEDIELLAEHPEWLAYELPESARSSKTGRGQAQKWFLVHLTRGTEGLDLGDPAGETGPLSEFVQWRWMTMPEMLQLVWPVRRSVYQRLAETFRLWLEEA